MHVAICGGAALLLFSFVALQPEISLDPDFAKTLTQREVR
jgi:hypothetical protein